MTVKLTEVRSDQGRVVDLGDVEDVRRVFEVRSGAPSVVKYVPQDESPGDGGASLSKLPVARGTRWRVRSNNIDMGVFEGVTEAEVVDAYAQSRGWATFDELCGNYRHGAPVVTLERLGGPVDASRMSLRDFLDWLIEERAAFARHVPLAAAEYLDAVPADGKLELGTWMEWFCEFPGQGGSV